MEELYDYFSYIHLLKMEQKKNMDKEKRNKKNDSII